MAPCFTRSVSRCWKISPELAGPVVFPTYFDAAFRLRKELQNPDLPISRIATVVSLEPVIAARLMQLAGSALYSPDGSAPRDLQAAIKRLGIEVVRTTALAIAMNQLMRSKETAILQRIYQSALGPFVACGCRFARIGPQADSGQPGRKPCWPVSCMIWAPST